MNKITRIILLTTLILIFLMRLHTAFIRYFDIDEFAQMHWAWLFTQGKVPYKDFFFYNLPVYQLTIMFPFFLNPDAAVLILTRIWHLLIYLIDVILIFRITKKITGDITTGLLAAVIFTAFPMTFDKTIDIRPDMVMFLYYLLAIDLITNTKIRKYAIRDFGIGFLFSLSTLSLAKIIFAMPAAILLYFTQKPRPKVKEVVFTLTGAAIPAAVFFAYLSANGVLAKTITMVTRDALAVNAGKIPFSPWKALSPWPLVYVDHEGPSYPWYVNNVIWAVAILGLIPLTIKKPRYGLFLLIFTGMGLIFLFKFPAPFLQYFLPLSIIASITASDFIISSVNIFKNPAKKIVKFSVLLIVSLLLLTSVFIQYKLRISPGAANTEQVGVIRDILKISKPDDTFYDMVGSYVFRPDGYYFCCHPFGEFINNLSFKTPPLSEELIKNRTKFVVLDRVGMSLWQTPEPELSFLKTNYLPSSYPKIYTPGQQFKCYGGECTQYNLDNQPVSGSGKNILRIIISDLYQITTDPPGRKVKIGDNIYPDGNQYLKARFYEVAVDDTLKGFKVQMVR